MTAALATVTPADDTMGRLRRVALATQGVLYAVMGLLALSPANGNLAAEPSQRGAIESVARQPFGWALVLALAVGFVVHALWRLALAARGEPGDGDDGASLAKRAANVGRAAVCAGLTVAALRTLVHASQEWRRPPALHGNRARRPGATTCPPVIARRTRSAFPRPGKRSPSVVERCRGRTPAPGGRAAALAGGSAP